MLLGGACILQEKVSFRGTSSAHCKTAEPMEVSILPAKGICGARPAEMHERLRGSRCHLGMDSWAHRTLNIAYWRHLVYTTEWRDGAMFPYVRFTMTTCYHLLIVTTPLSH